jgi:hypothetical protein
MADGWNFAVIVVTNWHRSKRFAYPGVVAEIAPETSFSCSSFSSAQAGTPSAAPILTRTSTVGERSPRSTNRT